VIFANRLGTITDLQVRPDGFMYVLVYEKEDGRIYRVVPMA